MTPWLPPVICLITDRRQYAPGGMPPAVAAAAAAGVDIIQVRERDLDDRALLSLVRELVAAAGPATPVVVNDRCDVALAAGAAGVHLRSDSFAALDVRRIAPPGFLVGRSVHSVAEATTAVAGGGYDYLVFGTVFASASKPAGHRVAGPGALSEVCRAAAAGASGDARRSPPVLAVGGVSERNAAEVAAAGAGGIAAIELFASARDLPGLVQELRRSFDASSTRA